MIPPVALPPADLPDFAEGTALVFTSRRKAEALPSKGVPVRAPPPPPAPELVTSTGPSNGFAAFAAEAYCFRRGFFWGVASASGGAFVAALMSVWWLA